MSFFSPLAPKKCIRVISGKEKENNSTQHSVALAQMKYKKDRPKYTKHTENCWGKRQRQEVEVTAQHMRMSFTK